VAVLAACASLTCGGDDGTGGDRVLRGVVYTTEPVVGARVTVRSLFNDFVYCSDVQTGSDGSFTCPILAGDDGNWYVVAEGGAGLPAGTTLRGGVLDVVPLEERTITVSPVSDLAVALADARVAAGKDPDRIAAYHTAVALFDAHWDTDPFDADVLDLTAPSSLDDGAKLTLAIHGLAQLAAQAAVEQGVAAGSLTQLQLLALLRQDVAAPGEVFDGEGGALRLGTCADGLFLCEVGADSLRGYLGGAILAFARTPANGTGLGRDDLLTWLERLRTNAEPQLFGAAAVGPFDPLAPTVSWAAPSEGATFTAGESIAIDVSAADANGVASVTVEVVGATATVTDTDPSPERFVAMVPVAGLPEGPLTLTATARDLDDNPASASRGVVIDQVSGGTISGTVTKGRVAGATVTAYRYGNGARGAAVGTGTTDAMGNLTNLLVADGTAGPLLLEATGGSYAEDSQPATSVTLDVADRLRTVIPAYTDGASLSTVQLTPLTELAVAYLEYLTSTSTGGADLAARWATAHGAIEAHFGVSNVRDVTPSTPAQVDTLAANDRYGLVLLGISRAAWRASAAGGGDAGAFGSAVNAYAVTRAWARDLGDGCWDGRAGTTTLTYGGVTPLTAEAARLHLAQAIVDYLGDGARNQTTFTTAADVLPLLDTVALAATSAPGACAGGALFATPGRPFDREPPVITFGAFPATDPFVRGTFDVTATATDNLDTEPSLTFTTGQTDIDIDRSEVRATIATAALPDGALTIGLASQDDSGNAATATRTVTVDNTAPVVTITAPAQAGGVYRTLNVAWTTVEPNVAATTAEVDGVAIVNGGGVSAEGPHTLTVTVDDLAGNRTTVTRTFTIDTAAPTISLTAPADGAHVRGPVTITFAATDANPGATATATLDGAAITSPHTLNVEGLHTLVVNATDAAGNPAAAVTRTFTIDNTAPTLTVTAPASGSFVRGPVTPTFSATDNFPPATVSATLDGNPFLSGTPINTEGSHTLVVNAVDQAGNAAPAVTRTFVLDNTAPVISVTAPAAGAFLRGPVTLMFAATDANPGATATATLDGAPITSPHTLNIEGPHTLVVNATDAAGNPAAAVTRTFTIDNTAPTLTVTAPASGSFVRGPVTPTFSATDNFPPATVSATLDGNPFLSGTPINTEGSHTLVVNAVDRAGNAAPAVTRTFILDNTAPVISVTAPAAGAFLRGPVTLTFAATDPNPGATATATLDGAVITSPHTLNIEGPHTLVVNATDAAGNPAAAVTRTFTIDNTAPTLTVTAPASGSFVRGPVTPTFSATDNFPPATVSATLDGNPFLSGTPINTEGSHTLVVNAVDRAGNAAPAVTRTFILDNTAPVISVTAPAAGAFLRGPVTITFAATDANPGATATATLDDAPITSPHTLNIEGPHTLVVNATDAAGNPAAAVTRTFTIDNTAPTLTVASPADGGAVQGPVTLTFNASDLNPGATISATLNGAPITSPWTIVAGGAYTLVVNATDAAGNAASTVTRAFLVDNAAPTWEPLVATPNGAYVRGTLTITATASDDLASAGSLDANIAVLATRDGVPVIPSLTYPPIAGGRRQVVATFDTAAAGDGVLNVQFGVVDRAGNAAAPLTTSVTLDNTAPSLIEVTGIDTSTGHRDWFEADELPPVRWVTTTTPTLLGTFVEANPGAVVALYVGAGSVPGTVTSATAWRGRVPTGSIPSGGVDVRIAVTDAAGNVAFVDRRVRYDGIAPEIQRLGTSIQDELNESVDVSPSQPSAPPAHTHNGPAIALNASGGCVTISKYAYLTAVTPPAGSQNVDNSIRWRFWADDGSGAGFDPTAGLPASQSALTYTVTVPGGAVRGPFTVDTIAAASDDRVLTGESALHRDGPKAIPELGMPGQVASGMFTYTFYARDRLGQTSMLGACWNHNPLGPPLRLTRAAAQASDPRWALASTLCSITGGAACDASLMNGVGNAAMLDLEVANTSGDPAYVTFAPVAPAAAPWTATWRQYWTLLSSTPSSLLCDPGSALMPPECAQVPTPIITTGSGTLAAPAMTTQAWRVDVNPFVAQTTCSGCGPEQYLIPAGQRWVVTSSLRSHPGLVPPGTLAPRVVFGGRAGNYTTTSTSTYCAAQTAPDGDGVYFCNAVGTYRPFKYLRATTLGLAGGNTIQLGWASRAASSLTPGTATAAMPPQLSRQVTSFTWASTE
jgi:hypothetical protein